MSARFEALVASLTAEHNRQLQELQSQIEALRDQLKDTPADWALPKLKDTTTSAGGADSLQTCVKIDDTSVEHRELSKHADGKSPKGNSVCVADSSPDFDMQGHASVRYRDVSKYSKYSTNVGQFGSLEKTSVLLRDSGHIEQFEHTSPVKPDKPSVSFGETSIDAFGHTKTQKTSVLFPALSLQENQKKEKNTFNRTSLKHILQSPHVEWFIMSVIVLNTLVTCLEVQYVGFDIAYSLGIKGYDKPAEDQWPGANTAMLIAERTFVIIFTIEFLLKVLVFQLAYFRQAFNWLDVIVVIAGLIDWITSSVWDPKVMRMVRLTRIVRILKSFRSARFLDAMHFLLTSIKASLSTLFWSLILIIAIQCIAALGICQLLDFWFDDATRTPESEEVFRYYGTFTRAIVTMFEILLANWVVPCRVLGHNVGEVFGLLVMVYKCVCGFAVINVVSAVFIQQTMKTMSQDTDLMLLQRSGTEKKFKDNLERLFTLLDVSCDGIVTMEELEERLESPDVRMMCFKMGLSVHDLEDIFQLHSSANGGMTINELVLAANCVRAQANSLDVARVLMHSRHLSTQVGSLQDNIDIVLRRLDSLLGITFPGNGRTYM